MKHYVEHNYHDHLHDPIAEDKTDEVTGANKRRAHRGGVAVPFPEKLHYMLSQVDGEGVSHIVSWQPHGRCFIVHKPQQFVQEVMPRYVIPRIFGCKKLVYHLTLHCSLADSSSKPN